MSATRETRLMKQEREQALAMEVLPFVIPELGCEEACRCRRVNKECRDLASEDHVWTGALAALEQAFPLDGTDGCYEATEQSFPPHAHGAQRDFNNFIPAEVELQHLVMPRYADARMQEGILVDLFHPEGANVGPEDFNTPRASVWMARPLPLHCEPCAIECDSYGSFASHCATWAHKQQLSNPDDRVPPWAIDPRHAESYTQLPTMRQYAAVSHYRSEMLAFFRAPMDAAGRANMAEFASWAREAVDEYAPVLGPTEEDIALAISNCTAENARNACVDFVIGDFIQDGMGGYPLDVVVRGWGAFEMHGSCSSRQLLTGITGLDWS